MNRWKVAFLGVVGAALVSGIVYQGLQLHWYHQWVNHTLWQLEQNNQVIMQFLQRQINNGTLK